MPRRSLAGPLFAAPLDPAGAVPLFRQLYDGLRGAILGGRLRPGERLPATRILGRELGVSRTTVVSAYEQLLAEGYLCGRVGSGTYVSACLPEEALHAPHPVGFPAANGAPVAPPGPLRAFPASGVARSEGTPRPFRPGVPALDEFPLEMWERLASRRWRSATAELLAYTAPGGFAPLREAVSVHLGTARAVRCQPEQVLIVAGAQQGFDLVARVLLGPGEAAWIEEPGYIGARAAFLASGVKLVPVPVDGEGIDVAAGERLAPGARLAYVTPSHQYPLGVTLSLGRRLALLDWARRAGAWVLEDDYDSEFRYAGRPLASLQGLDSDGRVLYLGTFSKPLFPSLRLGYLVVPPHLVETFLTARAVLDQHAPTHAQSVVADFLDEGHFARHVRRMRTLYAERQQALVRAVGRELSGWLELQPADTGLHLLGWLPPGVDDRAVSARASAAGVEAPPLSAYRLKPRGRGGLVLGYAGFAPRQIRDAVRRLAQVRAELPTPPGSGA